MEIKWESLGVDGSGWGVDVAKFKDQECHRGCGRPATGLVSSGYEIADAEMLCDECTTDLKEGLKL